MSVDNDRVILEAHEFDVPCESNQGCDAEDAISCRACGWMVLVCAAHTDALRGKHAAVVERGRKPECTGCGAPSGSFDDAFKVVAL